MARSILVLIVVLLAPPVAAAGPAQPGKLGAGDFRMAWTRPANRGAGAFSEQLKILIALEGGGTAYTRLLVTNVAGADGRAELVGKVELPGGKRYRTSQKRERGKWSFDDQGFGATVGSGRLEVAVGRAEVRIEGDGFELAYTVTSDLPGLRPKGGLGDFGRAFYETTIPIPRGRVQGTLKVGDAEALPLRGVAYVEQRATDLAPYRMARRWFKLKSIETDRIVVFSAFEQLGAAIQGWLLVTDPTGIVIYQDELEIGPKPGTRDTETGYALPASVVLRGEGGRFRGGLKPRSLTSKKDDLASLGKLERFVVEKLMKPWTFRFERAEYLFVRDAGGGAERRTKGRAEFEYQQLSAD